jgi:hypothetical protein
MLNINKLPKNTDKYLWTNHVLQKMAFYRLSESRIKRVLRNAKRVEEGIAPDTIASMQRNDSKKRKEEIWVMFQKNAKRQKGTSLLPATAKGKSNEKIIIMGSARYTNKIVIAGSTRYTNKIVIISAWRYPGVSPIGSRVPIPEGVLEDLKNDGLIR